MIFFRFFPLFFNKRFAGLFLLLSCVLLSGCKTELYSNLDEPEANQMLAALLSSGISSDKTPAKDNKWIVRVNSSEIPQALDILQAEGLPRPTFENMGQIFQKKGLISSPLEERVRYIYGLSQNLADTISLIDGVLVAKVHIVLPENDPFAKVVQPSSASVFIKCQDLEIINTNIPRIKKLVVNSIEGLSYDRVTIVPFIQNRPVSITNNNHFATLLGIKVAPASAAQLKLLFGGLAAAVLVIMTLVGLFFYFFHKKKNEQNSDNKEAAA